LVLFSMKMATVAPSPSSPRSPSSSPSPPIEYNLLTEFILFFVHGIKDCVFGVGLTFLFFPTYLTIVGWLGQNERITMVILTSLVHFVLYFGMNGFYTICDLYGYLTKYKIDRKPYQIPSKKLMLKTILQGSINQLTVQPLTFYFLWPLFKKYGSPDYLSPIEFSLPSISLMICQFFVCGLTNEFLFYWSHRALHLPMFYGRIHKQHHEYTGTIGFAAEYAHPIESIISNSIPTGIGAILLGVHPFVWIIWLCWRLMGTYTHHSGYYFNVPLIYIPLHITSPDWSLHHDLHHSNNTGNFGSVFWDVLFGTMIDGGNLHQKKCSKI